MKKNLLLTVLTVSMISVMALTGCSSNSNEAANEAASEVEEAAEEVTEDAAEALEDANEDAAEALEDANEDAAEALEDANEDAAEALEDVSEDAAEALEDANEDAAEALENVSEDALENLDEDVLAEFETLKDTLVYMGGLYISDSENDLMMCIFKNEGAPIVVVEKKGDLYYGELNTEDATLDDGREYTKFTLEDKDFGYHFKLDDEDGDSFLVDENGTVYDAKDMDESLAFDMVLDTLK